MTIHDAEDLLRAWERYEGTKMRVKSETPGTDSRTVAYEQFVTARAELAQWIARTIGPRPG